MSRTHEPARIALRVCAVLGLLLALLVSARPRPAWAGPNSMIPPGQEQRIRAMVDAAIAAAREADELPMPLQDSVELHIDRDRISVVVHPRDGSLSVSTPRLVLFHPSAVPDDVGGTIASGVALRCGPPGTPRDCKVSEAAPWVPLAERLVAARAPVADLIWQVEEQHSSTPPSATEELARAGVARDRGVALAALVGGLLLAGLGLTERLRAGDDPRRAERLRWPELALLVALVAGFVWATLHFTALLPLHEHNSFVARSDCAIDPRCTAPPNGAWNMTTMHVYGALLQRVPYRAAGLAGLSLAMSALALVLLWGLGRATVRALGRPELGAVAGLTAAAVLATHPLAWRLAGSASFWPWAIVWALAAALAGLRAAELCGREGWAAQVHGSFAWLVAAACLALTCGGNYVLLTLGACLGLAPLAWTSAWRSKTGARARILRLVLAGSAAALVFGLAAFEDLLIGYHSAFEGGGLDDSIPLREVLHNFSPLLLDPRVSARVWVVPLWCCMAWLLPLGASSPSPDPEQQRDRVRGVRGLRVFAPLAYAWLIPSAFLGLAAGEIIGSGYPVGFINHHWELHWTALAAGLGLAWIVSSLEQRWPLAPLLARVLGRELPGLRWTWVLPAALVLAAALANPGREQGWRMATGERVLEREHLALEQAFAELPEHDLLVVPPHVLPPTTDAPSEWDPLEVLFPRGFYAAAMRARGLEPAEVIALDFFLEREPKPGQRILFYLGSSLRSFQPHEIQAGAVPDDLERPTLRELHHAWEFEAVHEFRLATEQHPEISQRLGADRVPEIELGFYWLRPREHDSK